MSVNIYIAKLLNHFSYSPSQRIVEKYYRHRLKKPCLLMKQHEQWTIIPIEYGH